MTTPELARLVREMRRCQTAWFKFKQPEDLRYSKDLERRVDQAVAELLDPKQTTLFPPEAGPPAREPLPGQASFPWPPGRDRQ